MEILEPVLAEIAELGPRIEAVPRSLGDQDLTAVSGCADTRAAVDIDSNVALGGDGRLARMDPHANAHRTSRKRPLRRVRGSDSVGSIRERDE